MAPPGQLPFPAQHDVAALLCGRVRQLRCHQHGVCHCLLLVWTGGGARRRGRALRLPALLFLQRGHFRHHRLRKPGAVGRGGARPGFDRVALWTDDVRHRHRPGFRQVRAACGQHHLFQTRDYCALPRDYGLRISHHQRQPQPAYRCRGPGGAYPLRGQRRLSPAQVLPANPGARSRLIFSGGVDGSAPHRQREPAVRLDA